MLDIDFNDSTTLVWKVQNQKGKLANAKIFFTENEIPLIETPDTMIYSTRIAGTVRSEYVENLITRFRETDEWNPRSEEHTSELQSLMRSSYAVYCLKKK